MAKNKTKQIKKVEFNSLIKKYFNKEFLYEMIFNPKYLNFTCAILLIFEVILNIFIIEKVPYTEIDWVAYMQEVEGFLNGTLDYKDLKGDTGPLVYPAGFVYIYSLFYYITSSGQNIYLAQYIFLLIYIAQLCLIFRIYIKSEKIPPYALVISTLTSYRIHSIYVLRLFNDPIAVLFFYASLNMYLSNRWLVGSLLYSLAVSIKMNILLYAPCLFLAFLTNLTLTATFVNLFICGFVQIVLGAPFLYTSFWNYVKGSFDLGRVFLHKWTVNYRFLPKDVFENRWFHISLLALHVTLLLVFLSPMKRYLTSYAKLNYVFQELKQKDKALQSVQSRKQKKSNLKHPEGSSLKQNVSEEKLTKEQEHFLNSYEKQLRSRSNTTSKDVNVIENEEETDKIEINFGKMCQLFVLPFFVTNLIGVACARSLHYQFYSWYFHSLLYLVHCTGYSKSLMFLLLALIEYCWNTYPSTVLSSSVLHISHVILLIGIYRYMNR